MSRAEVIIEGEIPRKYKEKYREYAKESGLDNLDGYYIDGIKLEDCFVVGNECNMFFEGKFISVTIKIPIPELVEIISKEDVSKEIKEHVKRAKEIIAVTP